MEWCLNCHRDPAKNLRPVSQVYNMAWEAPSKDKPVWCSVNGEQTGKPTAQSVDCQTTEPGKTEVASLDLNALKLPGLRGVSAQAGAITGSMTAMPVPASYTKFTSQRELGNYLIDHYKIRKPNELASCEVCHR
jgi:hypothetical protein